MLQTKFIEKIKTHILCSITLFSSKSVPFNTVNGTLNYTRENFEIIVC